MLMVYPNGDDYFHQDNASYHSAGIVQDWFEEYEREFTLPRWPPQSPDINTIEHLWYEVERAIIHLDSQPSHLTLL